MHDFRIKGTGVCQNLVAESKFFLDRFDTSSLLVTRLLLGRCGRGCSLVFHLITYLCYKIIMTSC